MNDDEGDLGTSAEVQDFLQNIYFTCQFHATLLFHRPTFLRDFEEEQVPQPVLFALFANAVMSVYPLFRFFTESDQVLVSCPKHHPCIVRISLS